MDKCAGTVYPNGISKVRLFEIFLSCRDFGCSLDDYEADLVFVRMNEVNGQAHCNWTVDQNGRQFVADISLADDSKVLEILPGGFRLVPAKQRVFLSYAREDLRYADRLYKALKACGANPWMDTKNLRPGERWQVEIEQEIEGCTHFIALLSSRSVSKRGYVQSEIRRALEVLERLPQGTVFLMPVRLDDCQLSHRAFQDIHRVDLFPSWKTGLTKVLHALEIPTHSSSIGRTRAGKPARPAHVKR